MNTIQIEHILKRNLPSFLGVYARNRLPRRLDKSKAPFSIVANTDPDNKNGQHWVAIYVDENNIGEYYDPFGFPPIHRAFENFMNSNCTQWTYNYVSVQHPTSTVCGQHCIFYLILRNQGHQMHEITRLLTMDRHANSSFVNDFVKTL